MLNRAIWAVVAGLAVLNAVPVTAQGAFNWPPGKRAAIVLTYDDALASQLAVAIPQLDSVGLKGTFFLNARFTDVQLDRWRAASRNGHELGNHSVYHPCPASFFPAEPEYTFERYRVRTMLREIGVMNQLLHAIDGKSVRTYSYPCSVTQLSDGDYVDSLRRSGLVAFARTGGPFDSLVVSDPARLDRYRVPSWGFRDDPGSAAIIAFFERVRAKGGLGVMMFHGVGGDYQFVSARTHREVLRYLKSTPDIWTGTFGEVLTRASAVPPR